MSFEKTYEASKLSLIHTAYTRPLKENVTIFFYVNITAFIPSKCTFTQPQRDPKLRLRFLKIVCAYNMIKQAISVTGNSAFTKKIKGKKRKTLRMWRSNNVRPIITRTHFFVRNSPVLRVCEVLGSNNAYKKVCIIVRRLNRPGDVTELPLRKFDPITAISH